MKPEAEDPEKRKVKMRKVAIETLVGRAYTKVHFGGSLRVDDTRSEAKAKRES